MVKTFEKIKKGTADGKQITKIVPVSHMRIKQILMKTLDITVEQLDYIMSFAQASFHEDDDFSFSRLGRRILAKKKQLKQLVITDELNPEHLEILFPLPKGLSDSMIFTEEHRRIRDGGRLDSNEKYGKGINSKTADKLMQSSENRLQ